MGKLPRTIMTYRLHYPIEHEGHEIEAVSLTRPDDATLRSMVSLSLPATLAAKHCRIIIAIVSDLPPEKIGRLHPRDFRALAGIAIGLVERPPGETVQ